MSVLSKAMLVAGAMLFAAPASAANIVVSAQPWAGDYVVNNMKDVFGSDFTFIDSYAGADAGSVFSAANRFVYLEGSDHSDVTLATYLKTNTSPIARWVSAGGHLLIQSAGEHVPNNVVFAGITLARTPTTPNRSGTLTAAGVAAFTAFYLPQQHPSGASLAEDVVTGRGLTVFMTGDDNGSAIVAGLRYGRGTILFSALTDSYFHYPAPGGLLGDTNELVDDTIVVAASGTGFGVVPLPASAALLGSSLLALAGLSLGLNRKTAAERADGPRPA